MRTGDKDLPASKVYSWTSTVPEDWLTSRVMASYREDCYYLLPIHLLLADGAVLMDFAVTRTGYKLIQLPLEAPKDVGVDLTQPAASDARPVPADLKAFIGREFPGFPPLTDLR